MHCYCTMRLGIIASKINVTPKGARLSEKLLNNSTCNEI